MSCLDPDSHKRIFVNQNSVIAAVGPNFEAWGYQNPLIQRASEQRIRGQSQHSRTQVTSGHYLIVTNSDHKRESESCYGPSMLPFYCVAVKEL